MGGRCIKGTRQQVTSMTVTPFNLLLRESNLPEQSNAKPSCLTLECMEPEQAYVIDEDGPGPMPCK